MIEKAELKRGNIIIAAWSIRERVLSFNKKREEVFLPLPFFYSLDVLSTRNIYYSLGNIL
jgi:hypothetical protein